MLLSVCVTFKEEEIQYTFVGDEIDFSKFIALFLLKPK